VNILRYIMLAVWALCMAPSVALAFEELYDFKTFTCKELLSQGQQEASMLLIWVNGYNAGKTNRQKFITEEADKKFQGFVDYCKKNDSASIMKAYDESFGK